MTKARNIANGTGGGGATYTHPTSHPPSIISQDANNRFVTDAEKTTWNGKISTGGLKTINNTTLEGSGNINVGGTTAVVAKGSVGSGTVTFDVAASTYQTLTVTGGLTLAITGWPTTGTLGELTVEMDNGGSAALTMPTGIRWLKADGTYTTDFTQSGYTLLASGTNFLSFWTRTAGAPVWGRVL